MFFFGGDGKGFPGMPFPGMDDSGGKGFPGMPFPGMDDSGGKGFAGMPFPGMDMEDDEDEGDREKKEVDNSRLYDILELQKDCTEADVKKAYKRAAMKHHPDRGGDEEKFKEVSLAHEVLGDSERRKMYDEYGEESLKDDFEGPGSGPQDFFSAMFGGGPGGRSQQPKTRDIVRPMWVTLESLYTGVTKPLPITRKVVAEDTSEKITCPGCGGKGSVMQVIRMGPMIAGQQQVTCPKCAGTGKCVQQKTVREVLDVFIEKGSPDGHNITFHGKADEQLGSQTGDVVVIVKQQDHPKFLRKEADLYMEQDVTLGEALTGFRLVIPHLDGRKLIVKSKPGEVLQPQSGGVALKAVEGAGMPIHGDPFQFGNLFLVLSITFPRTIEPSVAADLRALLGDVCPSEGDDLDGAEVEEVIVQDIDPLESSKRGEKKAAQAYDEDEGPPGMVQCKQQ